MNADDTVEGNQKSKNDNKKKEGNKRDPKKLEEDKEGEECTVNDDTNRVRICVPKVTSVDSTIHLNSGEVKEERNCYDV